MISLRDEFLGKKIKIIASPMKHQLNVEGLVVDESKNTFVILCEGEEKKVLKKGRVFLIEGSEIDGDKINKRPEERIKIKEKKNG